MEDIVNRQIEMISVCAADGALTPDPLPHGGRRAYAAHRPDPAGRLLPALSYAGVEAIQYLCKTQLGQQEALLELRYTVRTHRWTLFRVVYGCPG